MSDKGKQLDVILSVDSGLAHDARYLAIALLRRSDKKGQCWPSLDTLRNDTGMSRRKIVEAIDALEHATGPVRVVVVRRCRKDGPGRASNVYTLIVDQSSNPELKSSPHQSSKGKLKSPDHQSSNGELKPSSSGVDLSSNSGGPEFQNGGDLNSDVGTGSHSGNLLTEPTQCGEPSNARARKSSGKKKRKPETLIPSAFSPAPGVFEMASKDLAFGRDRVLAELAKFKDHAETHERKVRNWQAAFRSWLRKAKEFDGNKPRGAAGPGLFQAPAREGQYDWTTKVSKELIS